MRLLASDEQFEVAFVRERLAFNGSEVMQLGFNIRNHSGLTDRPAMRRQSKSREHGPGGFPSQGVPDTRYVEMDGYVYARDMGELRSFQRGFNGLLADGGETVASVREFGIFRDLFVSAGEREWTFERVGSSGFADFEMSLEAPDPRFYGRELVTPPATQPAAASVEVSHGGNYWAPSVISMNTTGGLPGGYRIRLARITGETLGLVQLRPVPANTTVVLDTKEGTAIRGGVPQSQLAGGSMFEIPPYEPCVISLEPIGVGTGVIRITTHVTDL